MLKLFWDHSCFWLYRDGWKVWLRLLKLSPVASEWDHTTSDQPFSSSLYFLCCEGSILGVSHFLLHIAPGSSLPSPWPSHAPCLRSSASTWPRSRRSIQCRRWKWLFPSRSSFRITMFMYVDFSFTAALPRFSRQSHQSSVSVISIICHRVQVLFFPSYWGIEVTRYRGICPKHDTRYFLSSGNTIFRYEVWGMTFKVMRYIIKDLTIIKILSDVTRNS